MNARRPLQDDEPDGYQESDRDYVLNNIEAAVSLLDLAASPPLVTEGETVPGEAEHVLSIIDREIGSWQCEGPNGSTYVSALIEEERQAYRASSNTPHKEGLRARIKPEIVRSLREWAEFEQDGGNVEQGAAIDAILDWYEGAQNGR